MFLLFGHHFIVANIMSRETDLVLQENVDIQEEDLTFQKPKMTLNINWEPFYYVIWVFMGTEFCVHTHSSFQHHDGKAKTKCFCLHDIFSKEHVQFSVNEK